VAGKWELKRRKREGQRRRGRRKGSAEGGDGRSSRDWEAQRLRAEEGEKVGSELRTQRRISVGLQSHRTADSDSDGWDGY
jgi:hypothetical protein